MRLALLLALSAGPGALFCSASPDQPPVVTAGTPAATPPETAFDKFKDEVAADIAEVKTDISNEAAVLIGKAEDGYDWLKTELAKLEPTVAKDFDAAVTTVINDLVAGDTAGATVANILTVLARDGADVLAAVGSDVAAAYVALVAP